MHIFHCNSHTTTPTMAYSSSVKSLIVLLLIALMMVITPYPTSALTCGQTLSKISSCLAYLDNKESSPSSSCCSGIHSLHNALTTTKSRREACTCLKSASKEIKTLNHSRITSLPKKCGVHLSFEISVGIKCNRSDLKTLAFFMVLL